MNPQQSTKPMHLLYVDPERSGDPAVADFEDWEPLVAAREIHYLWPDGGELSVEEESLLDDFAVFAPTEDPNRLIMYSNMSVRSGQTPPFIGAAVLVNP